jgi:putative DNA primase/helicase
MNADQTLSEFRAALRAHGLIPPDRIQADGQLHRCDVDARNGKGDGAYVLHLSEVPAGGFQNWHDGSGWQDWCPIERGRLSADQRANFRAQAEGAREQRKADTEHRHAAARAAAARIWPNATPSTADHGYLARKGVQAHGLRLYSGDLMIGGMSCSGALIVPLCDAAGQLHSLQVIAADGQKRYLPGGRVTGCYFIIGELQGVLVIAEGFATAASIHEATGYATACVFDAGNLLAAAKALRTKLPGIRMIFGADNDVSASEMNVGLKSAQEAARAVGGLVAVPELDGEKCDFNDVMRAKGADVVRAAINAAEAPAVTIRTIEKRPLQRELPSPAEFPSDALGNVLGGAAATLHEATQAPIAICGNSVLAAAALATQPHADVFVDGRTYPISEFFITVGCSGERKSAVDTAALREHREHEKRLHEDFSFAQRDYKDSIDAYQKARSDALTKKGTVSQRKQAAADIGPEPCPPIEPLVLCEEPTFPGLVKYLARGRPSQGLFSDEGGRFLNSHAMNSDNAVSTLAGLSKLWDGKALDRVRAGEGATKLYGRRVSFHLMVQPGLVELLLGNRMAQDQGFVSRCLIAFPESTIGTRLYKEMDLAASIEMTRYHRCMRELLARQPRVDDELDPVRRLQLCPRAVHLSPPAKRLYIEFHDVIERDMAGELKELRAFANKAPEHMLRIATILTLVKDPDAEEISAQHVEAARELIAYFLSEAQRIVALSRQDPELRTAQGLLDWISQLNRPVSLVEIYQCGPSQLRSASGARSAAIILEQHGQIEKAQGVSYRGQVRAEAWKLMP